MGFGLRTPVCGVWVRDPSLWGLGEGPQSVGFGLETPVLENYLHQMVHVLYVLDPNHENGVKYNKEK